jgi:hypothetical protein
MKPYPLPPIKGLRVFNGLQRYNFFGIPAKFIFTFDNRRQVSAYSIGVSRGAWGIGMIRC